PATTGPAGAARTGRATGHGTACGAASRTGLGCAGGTSSFWRGAPSAAGTAAAAGAEPSGAGTDTASPSTSGTATHRTTSDGGDTASPGSAARGPRSAAVRTTVADCRVRDPRGETSVITARAGTRARSGRRIQTGRRGAVAVYLRARPRNSRTRLRSGAARPG